MEREITFDLLLKKIQSNKMEAESLGRSKTEIEAKISKLQGELESICNNISCYTICIESDEELLESARSEIDKSIKAQSPIIAKKTEQKRKYRKFVQTDKDHKIFATNGSQICDILEAVQLFAIENKSFTNNSLAELAGKNISPKYCRHVMHNLVSIGLASDGEHPKSSKSPISWTAKTFDFRKV